MCGIAGILNFDQDQEVSIEQLKIMTNSIVHRGPDDAGFHLDKNLGLGFRRLSIIDLELGHQPLSDSSGRYWITFNGEIYNYLELKENLVKRGYHFRTNSDTEVVVAMYSVFKEECLQYFRGMFSFVIWDNLKRQLFGARDRFGIKPFYYHNGDSKFIWASEMKAIKAAGVDEEIDFNSLNYYFSYGYTPNDGSIYKTIKKLKAGHFFTLDVRKNKIHIQKYWDIKFEPDYSRSTEYWKQEIYKLLSDSVKMRMISDVPLGAFLSGGIDSSIIVALMSLNSSKRIKTFSIGFKEQAFNELDYARLVAEKYNTDHHELIVEKESIDMIPSMVRAYDEPFADASQIPTFLVSRFARENVTVSLSGDGGDELFAGYHSYSKMNNLGKFNFLPRSFFKNLNKVYPDHFFGKGLSYYMSKKNDFRFAYYSLWKDYEKKDLIRKDIRSKLPGTSPEMFKSELLDRLESDYISQMQFVDMKTYLADDILTKVDIASMTNSLEARVPLLDHKFAELSFRIPSELKLHRGVKKFVLKEAFREILPSGIISNRKKGFSMPLKYWFREDWDEKTQETLVYSSHLYEFLEKDYVLHVLANHKKGMRDYSNKLWSILVFNEWLTQNFPK